MASSNSSSKNKSLSAMDASSTLTPLSSTRDNASFTIQMDDSSSDNSFAYKMRTKTAILQSVPEGRSVRAESIQSAQSQHQQVQHPYHVDNTAATAAKGEWNASLIGCLDFRKGCSDFLVLACCPCIPAAKIHGMLGSSFETGVMYFGCLVFGMLISLGLCSSNTSASTVTDASAPHTSSSRIYGNLGLVLLVLFLVGVAFLRTRTRHRFNIPGSRVFDCLLSLACCWCVLSQSQSHFEKHKCHEFGLDTPTDTLPAYP